MMMMDAVGLKNIVAVARENVHHGHARHHARSPGKDRSIKILVSYSRGWTD